MKMTFKKAMSLLLALAMVLTMGISTTAAVNIDSGTASFKLSTEDIFDETEKFTVTVVVENEITALASATFSFTYDTRYIVPCDASGTELTEWNDSVLASAIPSSHMIRSKRITKNTETNIGTITIAMTRMASDSDSIPVENGKLDVMSFNFAPVAAGTATLEYENTSYFTEFVDGATNNFYPVTLSTKNVVVQAMPNFPTVTSPSFTGAAVEDGTVTPTYEWDNGLTDEGATTTDRDISVVTWYVDDVEVESTVAKAALTVDGEWVGKELSYKIQPKADGRTLRNEGTLSDEVVVGMVKAVATYKPSVTSVTLDNNAPEDGQILAAVPVTPVVGYDDTYKENGAEYSADYQWYIVDEATDAADAANKVKTDASAAGITAKGTDATVTFDATTDRDKWAVVAVTAKVAVAGDNRTAEVAEYAAAKITGQPPEIKLTTDLTKKIRSGNTLKATFDIDNKYPEGELTLVDPITTYAWTVTNPATEEVIGSASTAEFKLTKDHVGGVVNLKITYKNGLGIYATPIDVVFANPVEKAAGGAPAAGTGANLSAPTTTPGTETPGTETPGTEPPGADVKEDPAGTANDKGAAVFTDVDKEAYAWAYEGIDVLTKSGVIKGMTESTFGPELTATNAQMIALAVRIAGLTAEGATTDKVDAEHWVAAELAVADAKGILSVYGDKVDAEGEVTREIAFTLLYNALKAAGAELAETAEAIEFTDAASIDANCVEAINALVKAGIVNGMGDGTLAPKATLTRAQLAKILGMANAIVAK